MNSDHEFYVADNKSRVGESQTYKDNSQSSGHYKLIIKNLNNNSFNFEN